ncbi:MAG TPA: vWA domain-containing protein, partial [Pseudonocardiaceae bacterium]|nr:vWA domain-containing protein [Pseudonocardiaceae bacterium]
MHQNLHLAEGAREVHAVITVDAEAEHDRAPESSGPAAAEVLILDCSGSMGHSPEQIAQAKRAAAAGIEELRDGVSFAVIAGSSVARMHWPAEPALVPANARTRAAAIASLDRLRADGGTAIGAWLRLAGRLLGTYPATTIRHAVLLTDGRDEHESPAELAAAVRDCAGLFTCDCRGVGTDWSVPELRTIASALLGTVGMVAEPDGLVQDFRAMMTSSMRKGVCEVGLRLWTPVGATVRFVMQVAPDLVDLTARRLDSGPQTCDYPTGSWGTESRDYHLCINVEPGDLGDEKLAGRVTFVQPGPENAT